jgi:hypothetical protein
LDGMGIHSRRFGSRVPALDEQKRQLGKTQIRAACPIGIISRHP